MLGKLTKLINNFYSNWTWTHFLSRSFCTVLQQ